MLTAGVVMGPLFVVTGFVQALTRHGFDLSHHPLSLLSLGDLGWIQIANFVATGLLGVTFAVGVARTLRTGPGHVWVPWLFAIVGVGFVVGGVFLPDAALGYPPGTPDEIPDEFSVHGTIHAAAPVVAFIALVAVCFVIARRFHARGRRTAAIVTRIIGVACLGLSVPGGDGASLRLFAGITLGFTWVTAVALDLMSGDHGRTTARETHEHSHPGVNHG